MEGSTPGSLRILHVIPSLDPADGGPSVAVPVLAGILAEQGHEVAVATTSADADVRESEQGGVRYFYFPRTTRRYKASRKLALWLNEHVRDYDLFHLHALFSFSSTTAARAARKSGVPYIVRPLGVLNRWGMQNRRRLPKLVSFRLIERDILLKSAAIHYTSEAERDEAGALDKQVRKHPSVVIPLPVATPLPSGKVLSENYPELEGREVILFLSRIDRKKGLELLLDAFALLRTDRPNAALVIAGDGDRSYIRDLRERSSTVNNVKHIIWTGHLTGDVKSAALEGADVFVLPSASENFGIAAAEALTAGVPTIVSQEVGLSSDIRDYNAGVVVRRDIEELAGAIRSLLENRAKAQELGANGRRLAQERYSFEAAGRAVSELYARTIRERTVR